MAKVQRPVFYHLLYFICRSMGIAQKFLEASNMGKQNHRHTESITVDDREDSHARYVPIHHCFCHGRFSCQVFSIHHCICHERFPCQVCAYPSLYSTWTIPTPHVCLSMTVFVRDDSHATCVPIHHYLSERIPIPCMCLSITVFFRDDSHAMYVPIHHCICHG